MKESALRARYRRIVWFFARVTASFIWWEVVLRRVGFGWLADRTRNRRNARTAARFRMLAIALGGLMIKVGQFMSARLDVLPPEITEELAGLQDEVPPEPYAAIREVALAELDSPLSEHFAWFDEEPLAAASLGQVHRARLTQADAAEVGFDKVVVKVQRPHIRQVIEVDLAALRRVARWLTHYRPVASRADVRALVEEFAETTLAEVDYLAEAGNAERFAANFAEHPQVSVPRVVWERTTRRVLTLEDVSAIRIGDHEAITAAGIDRGDVANVLADTYLQQIFVDGFFHADPHPGNLFVTPRPDGAPGEPDWTLTFVDFGMVGRVPDTLRDGLTEALIAIGTRDGTRLVHSMQTLDVLLPGADLALIERASMQVFDRFGGMSMDQLRNVDEAEMRRFGLQFRGLMQAMPFQLPQHMLMLGRSIGLLSGMCTGLDPDFNIWGTITPYAKELVSEEGGSTTDRIVAEAGKLALLALGLPGRADRVLTMAERSELTLQTPQLTRQVRRLQRTLTRTNALLVFAALLVAGALVLGPEPVLGRWLMGASVVPLLWAMVAGRGGRHGGA